MSKYLFVLLLIIIIILYILCNKIKNENFLQRKFGYTRRHKSRNFKVVKTINKMKNPKGVFSISLYGDDNDKKFYERYVKDLFKNLKTLKRLFPEWTFRIYLDPKISKTTRRKIIDKGGEIYVMNKSSVGHEGMTWRFLPADEDLPFIVLDSDDNVDLNKKDHYDTCWIDHVEKWIKSDKRIFHHKIPVVNTLLIPLSGKYWGAKPKTLPNMNKLINEYCGEWYGADEAFLVKEIWPFFKKNDVYTTPTNKMEKNFFRYLIIILLIIVLLITVYLTTNYSS